MIVEHVLYNVDRADIEYKPFPHVVIKPYSDDIIRALISETPECHEFPGYKNLENHRMTYLASDFLNRADLDSRPTWKKFIQLHTSQE